MTVGLEVAYGFDRRCPITAHEGLAASQFFDEFSQVEGSVLNVAAGCTDLARDLRHVGLSLEVTSLDPTYGRMDLMPPVANRIPGFGQNIPFEDGTFALAFCHFGLQHIPGADLPLVIQEMVRVTQPADNIDDTARGTILAGPVFKPAALTDGMLMQGLKDVCGIIYPPTNVQGKDVLPALIVKKTPDLTDEKLNQLIEVLQQTGAMSRRRTLAELISRLIFRGYSNL